MLNYKKMLALGIVALAVLAGLTKIRANQLNLTKSVSCVESCSFTKPENFNIANILSIKFR